MASLSEIGYISVLLYPILGSIFPKNLICSDKKYRAPKSDSVISLIANIAKVSGGIEIQKVTNNGDQSLSAPREGLEPPT